MGHGRLTATSSLSPAGGRAGRLAAGAGRAALGMLWLALRAIALVAYTLLAMGDIFVAPILGFVAVSSFALAVLFGFMLGMLPHKWGVLALSLLTMFTYFAYRGLMALMLRVVRG